MREQTFPLDSERNRQLACRAIATAPPRRQCVISDMTRTEKQHLRFMAMIVAIRKAGATFGDRELDQMEWYDLFTSGFLKAMRDEEPGAMRGIEGELVMLNRRHASKFTIAEFGDLMTYTEVWMANHKIPFGDDPGPIDPRMESRDE